MTTVTGKITAAGLAELDLTGNYTVTTSAPVPTKPAIPDGIYPMGFQGLVKGVAKTLVDYEGDWNYAKMGPDLSGYRIHGAVIPRNNGYVGDGFSIVGTPVTGSTGNALLDINTHYTGATPNFKHFTIDPDVTVQSVNGWMGGEATFFDFDIANVGGDSMSPNNLHTGLPLNIKADWGLCRDQVYYVKDSHPDGTHNDGVQIPGGTGATFTRVYMTGIASPTRGDGVLLRTKGPQIPAPYLPGPRVLGQINSAVMVTQHVSHVGGIVFDHCRFGGGWYSTINLDSVGNAAKLGPFTITNCVFDGNSFYGYDIVASPGTILTQSGNTRVDGKPLKIKLNNN